MLRGMKDRTAIIRSFYINLIRIQKLLAIFFIYTTLDQRNKQIRLKHRKGILQIILKLCYIQTLFSLLIQSLFQPFHTFRKLQSIDRLQHVFLYFQMNSFLRIFKLIKSCKNDDMDILIFFIQSPGKLQSIHIWHLDIGYHDIRLLLLHELQCFHTVCRTSNNFKS